MRNWILLLLIVTAMTTGCGGGADGDPTGLNEGMLEVIASTTGSGPDPEGYTISVDNGAPRSLPSNGADTVASLVPGTHTVTLAGVAPGCLLGGENPRDVEITAATIASLRFDVACDQPSAIWITSSVPATRYSSAPGDRLTSTTGQWWTATASSTSRVWATSTSPASGTRT